MFREDFPFLNSCLYFNTAYVGLMSKSLFNYRNKIELNYLNSGDQYKIDANQKIKKIQKSISDFIGSDDAKTFFVSNFSIGIRIVLDRIREESNVLIIEQDYHSIISAVDERKFSVFTINLDEKVEESIIESIKKNKVEVVVLSLVQYASGFFIDFKFLDELKNKFPNILIIGDASQFLGTDFFNFLNSPFDAIICSGYKWLLAGFGNGFLTFSENFLSKTNTNSQVISDKVYVGHFDILSAYSLEFSLKKFREVNFKSLVQENQRLVLYLKEKLFEMGLSPFLNKEGLESSIISISSNEKISKILLKNNVHFSLRNGYIRFSIHFYNNQNDIENLINILEESL